MKKFLLSALALVAVAALAITGTIAYLTWDDSDINVMTLGNVSIAQHEYERATNADGSYKTTTVDGVASYELQDFTQGKPLLPIVGDPSEPGDSDAYAGWDSIPVRMSQVDSYGGMKVFAGKNAQDKFVTVENTGKTDAYVRTIIAIEIGSTNGTLIGKSYQDSAWTETRVDNIVINGNTYMVFEYNYPGALLSDGTYRHENGVLPAGDTTYPNFAQVYLKHNATNEDIEAIDGNKNGTLDILVVSQAVQVAGFADAKTALDAAFGEITTENHPWKDVTIADKVGITEGGTYDLKGDVYTIDTGYFHTQKVTEPVTINGNGAVVNGTATSADVFQWEGGTIPAMSPIFSSADGSKVTVNDLTFTGTMSAISLGHYVNSSSNWYDTELNNVDVIGTKVVSFSANTSPAMVVYGKAVLNNCNVYGTTLSELDTDPMWQVYDITAVNYSNLTVNNSKVGSLYMWNQAKVTVADGSEVDSVVIRGNMNTNNYGLTIQDGATVGVIDLSAITDKSKVNITIGEDASVGGFVANNVEYASIADWQNAQ